MGFADWYMRLVSSVVFPLHERLKGHSTVAARKAFETTEWWPRAHLHELQVARLRELLVHAERSVPYYRDLFRDRGINPGAIQSLADLDRLPFLTKAIIRANIERLKSETARDLQRFNTGGSSGEPLVFFIGKERVARDVAAKWRAIRWWGVDIGDPEIVVWGSPIELGAQDRLRALRDRIFRSELLPAFEMSDAKLDRYVARIRTCRPRMLFGYPSSLALIGRHAEKSGVDLTNLGIRVAFVTSERLYDDQRERIGRAFGCRVANGYGGRDAGFIAHECPEGGMHITAEDVIVETVDPSGQVLPPGEAGEIVVTHLATKDFPFVRYRTGDVGALDERPCSCGRGLPLLKEIQGRSTDFVVAANGTVMHGLALIYVLRELPGIETFKIIQENQTRVRVMLVAGTAFDPMLEETICRGFRARLGEMVAVEIERVSAIAAERSGKFRYVQSHVPVQ
jgi:phenylacetate-CoA ligase